jgi:hypothetical protein
MSGSYYVMADEEHGHTWQFTAAQVEQAIHAAFPQAATAGPWEAFDVHEATIPLEGADRPMRFSYFAENRFFTFRDRDPIDAHFQALFTVLAALAPTVPVIWYADWYFQPQRVDLSAGLPELLGPFELGDPE